MGVFIVLVMLPQGTKGVIFKQPHSNSIVHLPVNEVVVKVRVKLLVIILVMVVVVIVSMDLMGVFPLVQEVNY